MTDWTAPSPDTRFVTLEDLADYMKVPNYVEDSDNGPILNEALDAAITWAENGCGPVGVDEYTYRAEPRGRSLVLPTLDLREVLSVTSPSGTEVTPVAVKLGAAVITLPDPVEAGVYEVLVRPRVLPLASMALAVKLVASHLFQPRRGNSRQAGGVAPVSDSSGTRGYAIPRRASELVAPYWLP